MRKKTIFLMISIFWLLSACVSSPPNSGEKDPSAPSEIDVPQKETAFTHGVQYAGDDTFIYFSNPNDKNALYRMTTELTEIVRLDDMQCYDFFGDGEFIYYNSWNPDESQRTSPNPVIYSIRTDGTEKTELKKEASIAGITDTCILFTADQQLKRMKKNGADEKTLLPDITQISHFVVTPEYVFYSNMSDGDDSGLYRIDIDGSNLVKLSDEYAWWTNVVDDKVYYGQDNLVVMDIDGSNKKVVAQGEFGRLVVSGDWVYYSDYATDTNNLCKIRIDGTEKALLFEGNVSSINIIGERIFFTVYATADGSPDTIYTDYCIGIDGSGLQKLTN